MASRKTPEWVKGEGIFGRLKIINTSIVNNRRFVFCLCECGNKKLIDAYSVRSGATKSCGCIASEITVSRNTTHGLGFMKEYKRWIYMKGRCYNKKNNRYHLYGGRGIKVCERWLNSFNNFFEDMGFLPSPSYTLERIDNNSDYSPSNCIWATQATQQKNKSVTILVEYRSEIKVLPEWARIFNIPVRNLYKRYHEGKTGDDLFLNKNQKI